MQKNKFGLWSIVLLGLNSIIGTGIFLMPGKAYALLGTSSVIAYLFVAVLAGSIALCFAEAAGLFETNGSAYVYTKKAFGNFAGFEVGVMKYIVQIIAWATMAVGFVTALSSFYPQLAEGTIGHSIAIVVIVGGLTLINLSGVDIIKYVNNAATFAKLLPLALFIVVGLFALKGANFHPVIPENITQGSFSSAVILVFYAFTGFEAIATAAEDMEDPKKNIPIAIALCMLIVFLFYVLIQIVCIGVLGSELSTTSTPVATAGGAFMGETGLYLLGIGSLISMGGINVAASFHTPRGCVALAEQNMLPREVMAKSKNGVPYVAILLSGLLTIPLALSGSFTYLATISVISRFAQYIPTCLAVMKFRHEGMVSTFRIPFGPVIPVLALVVSGWLLFNSDYIKLAYGLGAMIIIVPLYFLMKQYNKRKGLTFED